MSTNVLCVLSRNNFSLVLIQGVKMCPGQRRESVLHYSSFCIKVS